MRRPPTTPLLGPLLGLLSCYSHDPAALGETTGATDLAITTTATIAATTTATAADTAADTGPDGDPTGDLACAGTLPDHWNDGTDCNEPQIQVHAYDQDTYILRQSLCTSFEGPFMVLLFGTERALLLDTGDGGIPISEVVDGLVADWSRAHARPNLELIVANSHAHGDHTAGNEQFVGHADTTLVGVGAPAVRDFFGITDWPYQVVEYDLGDRVLDVIPLPGHEPAHIALYDRNTGLALTGDTLYPGRLYIDDFTDYVASVRRLVDHLEGKPVCHVLGAHIEMTNTPGEDFDYMQPSHPDEHPLPLDMAHLIELRDAVDAMPEPALEVHDDFIVYPL